MVKPYGNKWNAAKAHYLGIPVPDTRSTNSGKRKHSETLWPFERRKASFTQFTFENPDRRTHTVINYVAWVKTKPEGTVAGYATLVEPYDHKWSAAKAAYEQSDENPQAKSSPMALFGEVGLGRQGNANHRNPDPLLQ
jgi:hypothetical protein